MAHPGYCETTMVTGSQAAMGPVLGRLLNAIAGMVAYSPKEGALTPVSAANGPWPSDARSLHREYYLLLPVHMHAVCGSAVHCSACRYPDCVLSSDAHLCAPPAWFAFLSRLVTVQSRWQLFLATSPRVEAEDIRGRYFVPIADPATPSAVAEDVSKCAEAMEWTLQELVSRGFLQPPV
jgi:hypothetical protein